MRLWSDFHSSGWVWPASPVLKYKPLLYKARKCISISLCVHICLLSHHLSSPLSFKKLYFVSDPEEVKWYHYVIKRAMIISNHICVITYSDRFTVIPISSEKKKLITKVAKGRKLMKVFQLNNFLSVTGRNVSVMCMQMNITGWEKSTPDETWNTEPMHKVNIHTLKGVKTTTQRKQL